MNVYLSMDWQDCKRKGHRFKVVGSDKTPLKRNLMCETCTLATGKSCYVAYGISVDVEATKEAKGK